MTDGRHDVTVVTRHLIALERARLHLEQHRGVEPGDLAADTDKLWAIERGLQLCTQNALDIATHLAAAAGHDATSYAASVDALSILKILPQDFARRFRGIAGFRNILVHAYLDVDVVRMCALLNDALDDFRVFAEHIEATLGR